MQRDLTQLGVLARAFGLDGRKSQPGLGGPVPHRVQGLALRLGRVPLKPVCHHPLPLGSQQFPALEQTAGLDQLRLEGHPSYLGLLTALQQRCQGVAIQHQQQERQERYDQNDLFAFAEHHC